MPNRNLNGFKQDLRVPAWNSMRWYRIVLPGYGDITTCAPEPLKIQQPLFQRTIDYRGR